MENSGKKTFACWAGALLALLCLLTLTGMAQAAVDNTPPDKFIQKIKKPWTGDLPDMVQRRAIRVLVTYNKTNYFLDGARERGITYEAMQQYAKYLNKRLARQGKKKKHLAVHILLIPVARDKLLSYLVQGKGDIAAANLTVTKKRLKQVDFCAPFASGVKELVVTGPGAPAIKKLSGLSGKTVYVRRSSSYYGSLKKLNRQFKQKGIKPVKIDLADENLETEDILEMVNAGLVPITVADSHLADFWSKIFKNLKVHENLLLAKNGKIAWAVRKNSPKLMQSINAFVKKNKQGTLMGNILIKRYFENTKWAENALSPENIKRFDHTTKFFQKYADQYGFDWLMLTALAFQESGLDNSKVSHVGAVGVMQLMPSTASGPPVSIPDYKKLESNVHAGTKYLRWIYDQYFKNDKKVSQLNKVLFTFAAYNAGPGRVIGLRKRAVKMGLNPNVWFHNVEEAAARVIGRETVHYVSNIYKYYIAYRQILAQHLQREEALKKK
ncbi:MAG: lytic transglycosylase F [Desulfarculaceae bacterium]|nr:lytic transglycosylase F [Desulfarculaceae bacterium]MCF8046364.1 lytic transglycosylase F [Desulfarculaceae bacterium]MCF8064781.1 lytic transglycosylase F [Desulfarculaceae bacterium]MCF8097355.1 lytic transglycosylase F [Desulfarculaceae bacterium]MCF8123220.1 lytic transglycosylase F [Desulfarculaceae bacterium]